jgi:hypothetical protein
MPFWTNPISMETAVKSIPGSPGGDRAGRWRQADKGLALGRGPYRPKEHDQATMGALPSESDTCERLNAVDDRLTLTRLGQQQYDRLIRLRSLLEDNLGSMADRLLTVEQLGVNARPAQATAADDRRQGLITQR